MLPTFVCIGSQKAGTGWLYKNLSFHPEIWMSPIKELQYFTRPSNFYILTLLNGDHLKRRSVIQDLKRSWHHLKVNPGDLDWFIRFFFFPRNDKWYASLFTPNFGQVCGEVTPDYETLPAEEVAQFYQLLPNTKLIFIMRNPIDRIWSNTAHYFRVTGYPNLEMVAEKKIEDYLMNNKFVLRRSDYINTLKIWESFYPSEQIFTGFQDQMRNDPKGLLMNIYRFLGVELGEACIPKDLDKRKNVGSYPDIPPNFARMLAERYLEMLEKLNDRFQNQYTKEWLAYTQQFL